MRVWYAVCVDRDVDHGIGSTRKREAYKMARAAHRYHPDSRVEIAVVDSKDDFCLDVITVYDDGGNYVLGE